jgi:hypothetical protein
MKKLLVTAAIVMSFMLLSSSNLQAQQRRINPRLLRPAPVRPAPNAIRPVFPTANLGAITAFTPNVNTSSMYTPFGVIPNGFYVPTNPSLNPTYNPYAYNPGSFSSYNPYYYSGYNPYSYNPGFVNPNYYSGYNPYLYSSIPNYIPPYSNFGY